jgi:cysteinyl-tRNA synthetase
MIMLKLYNSLTRKKETFRPINKDNHVGLYTCGITAYFSAHIGNMRTYTNQDIIKRLLMHNGYTGVHVENITDVGHLVSDADTGEDKLRLEATKERKSMKEVADFYTEVYLKDRQLLNLIPPDYMPKATDHIKEMLDLLELLDQKGFLYKAENGIYFDTSKFKDYGKLTGMTFKQLNSQQREGARVEKVEGKRNATDFAVWRFAPGGEKEMVWDSKWGMGFPGWHLECSAMSMKYLGKHFDIHCGGIDHLQIHHPNEIAQSEAATGEKFVNYWMHMNFLTVDGNKMSKSLRNIYTMQDIVEKGYSPMALRLFYISGHYRQSLNFTFEALSNTEKTLKGIYSFIERLAEVGNKEENPDTAEFKKKIAGYKKDFFKELNNDINMPAALANLHAVINETNARAKLNRKEARAVIKAVLEMDQILGLKMGRHVQANKRLDDDIQKLVNEREAARKNKDFKRSDEIRAMLKGKYRVVLEDTKEGVRWHKE